MLNKCMFWPSMRSSGDVNISSSNFERLAFSSSSIELFWEGYAQKLDSCNGPYMIPALPRQGASLSGPRLRQEGIVPAASWSPLVLHCASERGLAHEAGKAAWSFVQKFAGLSSSVTASGHPGSAFYRPESAQARDLAVLAVRVQQKVLGWVTVSHWHPFGSSPVPASIQLGQCAGLPNFGYLMPWLALESGQRVTFSR